MATLTNNPTTFSTTTSLLMLFAFLFGCLVAALSMVGLVLTALFI